MIFHVREPNGRLSPVVLDNSLVIASIAFAVAVFVWAWLSACSEYQANAPGQGTRQRNCCFIPFVLCCQSPRNQPQNKSNNGVDDMLMKVLTGVLAFAAIQTWLVYRAMHRTMRLVERAFLFVESFDTQLVNDQIWIFAKWKNSGTTPALRRKTYANYKLFDGTPPDDWTWPDLDKWGNPISGPGESGEAFVGPQTTILSAPLKVNVRLLAPR